MSDKGNLYELTLLNTKGQRFKIEVKPTDTIEAVKEKAVPVVDIPLERLLLIYYGKHLAEGKTIQDYKIENKSTLQVISTSYSVQLKGMTFIQFLVVYLYFLSSQKLICRSSPQSSPSTLIISAFP